MNKNLKTRIMETAKNNKLVIGFIITLNIVAVGICILISVTFSTIPSLPNNRNIFTLHDTYNMTVVVVFDEELPIV